MTQLLLSRQHEQLEHPGWCPRRDRRQPGRCLTATDSASPGEHAAALVPVPRALLEAVEGAKKTQHKHLPQSGPLLASYD